jgi:hypothetical protein
MRDYAVPQAPFLEVWGNVPFDMLLGRRSYEIFAAYWPNAPEGSAASR